MKRKYLETEVGTYQHNSDQIFIGMLVNDIFPEKKLSVSMPYKSKAKINKEPNITILSRLQSWFNQEDTLALGKVYISAQICCDQ